MVSVAGLPVVSHGGPALLPQRVALEYFASDFANHLGAKGWDSS